MSTKKTKNKMAARNKNNAVAVGATSNGKSVKAQLMGWAHEGSKESLEKIMDFIIKNKNEELADFANLAHEEAEFFYYSPKNDQEENDLLVAKMIREHDDRLWKLMDKADKAKFELQKLDIEREIDKNIFRSAYKTEKGWGYEDPARFSEDFYTTERMELEGIEKDIEYESKWIEEAKKLIKTERFKDMPDDFFDNLHFDVEGGIFWEDDFEEFGEDDNLMEDEYEI